MKAPGLATPWNSYWERFYAYELGPVEERFSPITNKATCVENLDSPDRTAVSRSYKWSGISRELTAKWNLIPNPQPAHAILKRP